MGILDELRNRFGGGDTPEPVEPPGFEPRAEAANDSADMLLAAEPEPEPLLEGLTVGLTYEDIEGNISERLVNSIRLVETPEGEFLWAYCHLRNDYRAFRLDRIRQVRDYKSGAHTDDPVSFFEPYMSAAEREDTLHTDFESRTTREVLGLIGDELRILAFVALADRRLDEREEELIADFVRARARELGAEVMENYDHGRVLDWMRAQKPTFSGLERAVERLSARGEWELRALWDLSNDIVHADEHVDADEIRAMDDLYNAIDRAVRMRRAAMD